MNKLVVGNKLKGVPSWLSSKKFTCQCRRLKRCGSIPGLGRPLEKEMATTPVFLSGKSLGQRSLVGYSLWGHKESDITEQLTLSYATSGPNSEKPGFYSRGVLEYLQAVLGC